MHANEAMVRDGYAAMSKGDGSKLAALLGPKSQWILPGTSPIAGTYTGPPVIFEHWKRIAVETGGGTKMDVIDVLANDDRAAALIRMHGSRGERTYDGHQVAIFEIADGLISSATFVHHDAAAWDAFWS